MIEKCNIAANEISNLEVLNNSTITTALSQLENTRVSHLLITDSAGASVYDSTRDISEEIHYILFPEVATALNGNNVFSGKYREGVIRSCAATPIYSYGTLIGCVYMMEIDTQQGALIQSLQKNTLTISVILEFAVIIFSLI